MIKKCDWASEPLDKINDQQAQHFAAKYAGLSPSRINCGLRTLRGALNVSFRGGGKLERPVKITLAKGERQRDRVLSDAEWQQYIGESPIEAVLTPIGSELSQDGGCADSACFDRQCHTKHVREVGFDQSPVDRLLE